MATNLTITVGFHIVNCELYCMKRSEEIDIKITGQNPVYTK